MASVTLENITVSYNRHPAVHHVSGTFAAGSLTAVTGPNGGGKSTLLKTIAGLLKADEGRIIIERAARENIAYLPQASELRREFPLSVLQLVASGAWQQTGAFGRITPDMVAKAKKALDDVGLADVASRDLASLSSGQFQRALFARLIMQDASLILLDEPFTAMDMQTTQQLFTIMHSWHREGRTIICILHDARQIEDHFPECVLMARECVAWGKTPDVLRQDAWGNHHLLHEHMHGASLTICQQVS